MMTNTAREEMLGQIRSALKRTADSEVAAIPPTARIAPRATGDAKAELNLLLTEIGKLGGQTRRVTAAADRRAALRELVEQESIKKAVLWQTQEFKRLKIAETLSDCGVEIISPYASNHEVAECDLGVTGADLALPETGTLVLRSSIERPRTVSLLPRVHLALIKATCLRADLHQVFEETKHDGYFVFVTGSSRTSDIELTLTLGVHGPKTLCVMVLP